MATPDILDSSNSKHVAETCQTFGFAEAEFHDLHREAVAAKSTAYCPYSQFRVGCTIITDDGSLISGANVENASYPVGTCAERVAFGKAVTEGHRMFKGIAVATDVTPPCSPCGMCRQFIREFCPQEIPVLMFDKDGNFVVMRLRTLLPLSLGPETLPPPHVLLSARSQDS